VTLNAIRELLGIALKGKTTPTYKQSIEFAQQLSDKLFGYESLIRRSHESPLVLQYSQIAAAESQLQRQAVSPIDIIDREIRGLEGLLETEVNTSQIQRKITQLRNLRLSFVEKS